ncbi:hypothetical protein C1645_786608 [Glomus cerebriforme]|uniref:Uncharacterized protein n=1 Tax=Glomus cerebriforme TaxID=658196 RepID=A0A397SGK4_9GLOM|nr:hypothetical protein C1645_786608 [Glomus cerebriforme]
MKTQKNTVLCMRNEYIVAILYTSLHIVIRINKLLSTLNTELLAKTARLCDKDMGVLLMWISVPEELGRSHWNEALHDFEETICFDGVSELRLLGLCILTPYLSSYYSEIRGTYLHYLPQKMTSIICMEQSLPVKTVIRLEYYCPFRNSNQVIL